ncbi:MAG TPA: hypothetical protein VK658_16355 [Chryseolinea sp.]|nr:hypothetical protein [Chryseolinea sp.]
MESIFVIAVVLLALYLVFKLFKTLLKWLLIVVVILVAIAFFSNPDFNSHREKLTSMGKELGHDIKEKRVTFDDYKIFSLTKKKVNGKEKIVGIGAFGKVWYFDDDK